VPEFIEVCEQAARAAGELLLQMQHRVLIREKAPKDLVTEADVAAQREIARIVLAEFPDHDFLGEESGQGMSRSVTNGPSSGYRWIVDPLDGTVNYVHGLPSFAVSVALERDGKVLAGVVFDPLLQECYRATAGGGATLNGAPLAAGSCTSLASALVAASIGANVQRDSLEVQRFIEILYLSQSIRRLGSAALNMCYVAAGRLDAYWGTSVKSWDVAAGALILQEAGAVLTSIAGEPFCLENPALLCAATMGLHQELLEALRRVEDRTTKRT
jgi:myo-inositol-1(or 4)-monophosphatase